MTETSHILSPYRRRKIIWLCFAILLVVVSLYAMHLLASQGTTNPWVKFPIYQNTRAVDVVIDWPLVAWIDRPDLSQPGKVLIKNLETDFIRDLATDFPCQPAGSDRGDLALHGEWLTGIFSCNWPEPSKLYALNLNSEELILIEPPLGLPAEQSWPAEPAIYGDTIVWQQENVVRTLIDVFLFDLQSRTVISLTQTPSPVIEHHAEIYEDWLAWNSHNLSTGDHFIALYNLSSSEQISVSLPFSYDTWISLDNQYVVWTDWRNGTDNADVYGFDLICRQVLPLIMGPYHQSDPVIREGVIVYQDEGPPASLYVYHLDTQETYLLFEPPPSQTGISRQKAIDNGVIVWINGAVGPQGIVYGARQLPERFFLPILPQP